MSIPAPLLLIIATLFWGGNFVIGRAVSDDIPPISLAFYRWCVALLVLAPIAFTNWKAHLPTFKKHWKIVIVLSLTGVAGFNTLVYIGLHDTTSINASLMNSSTPIIIYILAFLFLRERLNRYQVIGTCISLIGVLFILTGGSLESLQSFAFNRGDMIVLLAIVCWGVYSLLIKQYAGILPSVPTFFMTIIIGIVTLLPFFLYESITAETSIIWNVTSVSAIFYVGTFASIVAFLSWNKGVVKLGASRASIYLNFIPVFSALFATLFIGESLQLFQVIGGLAVVAGVFITNRNRVGGSD
ncbi:DMT family transporter [Caryophanon latum]|uniref:Antibiotic transporter n=1 Tax=Caryophanon latum TaxID=33977 RepID=A0A1C0YFY7_9BACL|nr:DMT family transporter [Caryophanon latum]OCS86033.1 antibiotic transporter [Caryophanon latum]